MLEIFFWPFENDFFGATILLWKKKIYFIGKHAFSRTRDWCFRYRSLTVFIHQRRDGKRRKRCGCRYRFNAVRRCYVPGVHGRGRRVYNERLQRHDEEGDGSERARDCSSGGHYRHVHQRPEQINARYVKTEQCVLNIIRANVRRGGGRGGVSGANVQGIAIRS